MGKRTLCRQDLLDRVSECVVHHRGIRGLTLQGVAEATGLSLWALRYSFDNVDRLFHAVVEAKVDRIRDRLRYDHQARRAVMDTIQDYAAFVAEAMQSDDYRDFLYLVVRSGGDQAWLQSAYQRRIIGLMASEIERLVLAAGQSHGTPILLKDGAADRFIKRIEAEVVLPSLVPPFRTAAVAQDSLAEPLRTISRELFEATYAFAWESASAA